MDKPTALFERLWELLPIPQDWRARLPPAALLVVFAVAAGFVISPGLTGPQVPELTADDLGRPFRQASFKAGRDYEIPHRALTDVRRDEARAAVKPVYDLNRQVSREIRSAISDSFALMRREAAARSDDPPAKRKKTDQPDAPEAGGRLREARDRFEEGLFGPSEAALDDDDFDAMLAARFDPNLERIALQLLDRAYHAPVASSREELSREGKGGITVRDLADLSEHSASGLAPEVMDVREVQAELERFASVPGNVLPEAPMLLRRAVLRLAKRQVRPNLTINFAETSAREEKAAASVKEAVIQIRKGQKVIGDGELINETHLVVLAGMRSQTEQLDHFTLRVGAMGLVALLIGAAYLVHASSFRRIRLTRRDAILLGSLLVAMLGLVHVSVTVAEVIGDRYAGIPIEAMYYCIPVAAGAMLVRFILSETVAIFFAVVASCLAALLLGNSLAMGIYAMVGSLIAAERIRLAKDRVGIFRAGAETGAVNLVTVLVLAFAEGKGLTADTAFCAAAALVGTALALPMVVMVATPLIELGFGYASDIKLLELANLNHPALKELIVQAPGTYHHSIILGTMVEDAAEAIGANPLLARSCAYYHDLGKGRNPLFFGENQKGENRHDSLAPAMSALIIKRHVTEGMEMARQYRLPKAVADAIPQHHGTRLVGYFFHKAMKEQEGKENPTPIDESLYRYPGPKPQFKEAALVMIADAVEASTRAMPDQTTAKLRAQVQKIINMIFSEGQLDECDLTLKDLTLVARSFLHTLEGIYHARPQYPPGSSERSGISGPMVLTPQIVAAAESAKKSSGA